MGLFRRESKRIVIDEERARIHKLPMIQLLLEES